MKFSERWRGCLLVSYVPMLEQMIAKHTQNSVLENNITDTPFTVFFYKVPLFTVLTLLLNY